MYCVQIVYMCISAQMYWSSMYSVHVQFCRYYQGFKAPRYHTLSDLVLTVSACRDAGEITW